MGKIVGRLQECMRAVSVDGFEQLSCSVCGSRRWAIHAFRSRAPGYVGYASEYCILLFPGVSLAQVGFSLLTLGLRLSTMNAAAFLRLGFALPWLWEPLAYWLAHTPAI